MMPKPLWASRHWVCTFKTFAPSSPRDRSGKSVRPAPTAPTPRRQSRPQAGDFGGPPGFVEAIDGEGDLAGRFKVHHPGYEAFLPVYRDDTGTPVDEGADRGEWLTIRVNGQPVSQRVQWTTFGDEVKLDLEASSQPSSALPTESALGQNYPNPFNPSTTISYQLPSEQEIALSIWNLAW